MGPEGCVSTRQEQKKGRKTVQPSNVISKRKGPQNRNKWGLMSGLESLEHRVRVGKAGWCKLNGF